MPQLGNSTQQLKRIVVAVNGPVLIPDRKVFLRNRGDSRDLLAAELESAGIVQMNPMRDAGVMELESDGKIFGSSASV